MLQRFKKIIPYLIVAVEIVCFFLADYFAIWHADFLLNKNFIFGSFTGLLVLNIAIIILILFAFILIRRYQFGIGLILAGSISNLLDRIFYGGVIDYFRLPFRFPAFNLSDISICFGAFLIILTILFGNKLTNKTS
ncbi:MAG: signal peptidase II [Patescibacteria group bacterium]